MNSFGRLFRITLYGTSHNNETGIIIDGCPAGIEISESDFENDIKRRLPDKSGTTSRKEKDYPIIKSGIFNGYTNGTPLVISFYNNNNNPEEYNFDGFYRPGHADFVSHVKYKGFNDPFGGGQSSGRMTLPVVAAGVVAKKITENIQISSKLISVNGSDKISEEINKAHSEGDTVGGVVECKISNLPIGLGEPFFDSVEALLSHAMFSIPGAKAIEFGEGIKSAASKGSNFNDVFVSIDGKTKTNNNGGINGGITNGNELYFKLYLKPASSIKKPQKTLNFNTGKMQNLEIKGRHDTCYALRTPVIVEALAAVVIADLLLVARL
jgi:chorismate synthase